MSPETGSLLLLLLLCAGVTAVNLTTAGPTNDKEALAVKSGTCPAPVTICGISPSLPRPKPLCTSDNDCPGKQKCCKPNCRRECTDPLPLEKPGFCPPPYVNCRFPIPPPQCDSDSDCYGNKKCCSLRCYPECINPFTHVFNDDGPV
ncbi:antileukoproteinase-like isoform X1 [Rana temporaria]|uniref:antileukoproteinase-like isoform X1 n=1 Tax=Rana temporaria TaxID=8407 RepID=UPI001AACEB73|nr:antileukoproteinase-like isoform X1 [Rana temporaria]